MQLFLQHPSAFLPSPSDVPAAAPVPCLQSPNPWHVSFSYARALQNSVLKTWQGKPENAEAAKQALLKRASANSAAQLGKYDPSNESAGAGERTYEKGELLTIT